MKYFILILICFLIWQAKSESFSYFDIPTNVKDILVCDKLVSSKCCEVLKSYQEELSKKEMSWALQMLDATTKLQSGILYGNIKDFGNYDECLEVESTTNKGETIIGKHCFAQISGMDSFNLKKTAKEDNKDDEENPYEDMSFVWSICIPQQCSASDLNYLFRNLPLNFKEDNCHTKNDTIEFTTADTIASVVFGLFLLALVLSTIYDLYLYYSQTESKHVLLTAFSVISNGRKLLKINNSPNQITCLDGIRFLSMMWIVLAHDFDRSSMRPVVNFAKTLEWAEQLSSMYLIGGTVAVDTFFVLSGLVMTYVYLSLMEKGVKFNIIMYYVHRYLRLTPAVAALILLQVSLIKYFGSGPNWTSGYKTFLIEPCERGWWEPLLYVQNFVNLRDVCIGHSWYLAVDMQLFLISPLILLPLRKWPKTTIIGVILLAIGSMLWSFILAFENDWIGLMMGQDDPNGTANQRYADYYIKPYTRASPWLFGIILGYLIFKHKNVGRFKINKVFVVLLWLISLITLGLCVFGGHNLSSPKEYEAFENAAFIGFVAPAWAIGLCWVIYACVFEYSGPVNSFLSWSLFRIRSRFTYSIYVVHFTFLTAAAIAAQLPIHADDYTLFHQFLGDFVLIFVLAVVWTLTFESPIIIIENVLFGKLKSKSRDENPNVNVIVQ